MDASLGRSTRLLLHCTPLAVMRPIFPSSSCAGRCSPVILQVWQRAPVSQQTKRRKASGELCAVLCCAVPTHPTSLLC
jgi:hypothetical protein